MCEYFKYILMKYFIFIFTLKFFLIDNINSFSYIINNINKKHYKSFFYVKLNLEYIIYKVHLKQFCFVKFMLCYLRYLQKHIYYFIFFIFYINLLFLI